MKIGAVLFFGQSIQLLAANARRAEELGFESIWIGEHIGIPKKFDSKYPYSISGLPAFTTDTVFFDPFVALAYIAAQTSKVKLGIGVFVLPLRNPFATAKAIASVDQASNGRFIFGVGIGWLKEEFDWVGMPFENRALRTSETLKMMTELWSSPNPVFKGKTVSTEGFNMMPKTVQQPHPPFVFGGNTAAAMRRAARLGDGWYGLPDSVQTAEELIKDLRAAERDCGRQKPLEITLALTVRDISLDDIRRLRDLGVDRYLMTVGPKGQPEVLQRFHEQVITKL